MKAAAADDVITYHTQSITGLVLFIVITASVQASRVAALRISQQEAREAVEHQ